MVPASTTEPVPLVVAVTPVAVAKLRIPLVTATVTLTLAAPVGESTSANVMPVITSAVSSAVVIGPVTLIVGASFTAAISKLKILGVWSVSVPPKAVPPLSCTLKPSAPSAVPFLFSAGVNTSLPAVMSATVITWLAAMATPFSL